MAPSSCPCIWIAASTVAAGNPISTYCFTWEEQWEGGGGGERRGRGGGVRTGRNGRGQVEKRKKSVRTDSARS